MAQESEFLETLSSWEIRIGHNATLGQVDVGTRIITLLMSCHYEVDLKGYTIGCRR